MDIQTRVDPFKRKRARRLALQAAYHQFLTQESYEEVLEKFLIYENLEGVDVDYFREIFAGALENNLEAQKKFEPFLSRPLNQLDPMTRSILILAYYELESRLEIPYRIIIDEALDLSKAFAPTDAYRFVNGVLNKVAELLRPLEKKSKV